MEIKRRNKGVVVASIVGIIVLLFLADTGMKLYAQAQRKNEIKEEDSYQRPQPSRPIKPEVPGVNRYQEDKVFLEYADSLYKLNTPGDTLERQILKGNVKFRQGGLWMYCDSAYYFPTANSLDAFSNVWMEQGDTLFAYADKLFYNGNEHLAKLKNGPTRNKVTLINKDVTLTTDSLDYDLNLDLGWYVRWGTIDDKVNTLTSLYGEYSARTKMAEFFHDVVLVNHKDGFTMLTDTLYYSTETHIANIESRTEIQSENDTIITNLATYYTDTGDADLLSRSLIIHRDSTGNITTLEGDSIIYDNTTRVSRAYMFRDPFKHSSPMVITDTAQKTTLIGGFGIYNDSTKEALATIYPLLMEYSQGDTLFLRADTIKTYIVTEKIPDGKRKTKSGFPEYKGVPIVRADSNHLWIDTSYFALRIPFIDTPVEMLMRVAPPYVVENKPELLDTLAKEEEIVVNRNLKELKGSLHHGRHKDDIDLDSLGKNIPDILLKPGIEEETDSINLYKDLDKISGTGKLEVDSGATVIPEPDFLAPDSITKEYHVVLAYHRGRFFKQDMQGVADSMVFVERDSMLYMFRKPIIWSEERQVTGNRIDVHFNDSTTDWAYLPEFGLMSEHVEEDFYNQIYGKEIKTFFEGQGLRRMSVSGNVETIFLPQEEDSTYNRLVNAESSYMEVYLDSNKLDWLKMWPEVSGQVTPIFLVKRPQMYLQKFKWWGFLRPEREWYGDRIRWADNLGEVPDELEKYFLTPSDFGEPKSFSWTRFTPPATSLPIWDDLPELQDINEDDSDPDIDVNTSDFPDDSEAEENFIEYSESAGVKEAEEEDTLQEIEEEEAEENREEIATEEEFDE